MNQHRATRSLPVITAGFLLACTANPTAAPAADEWVPGKFMAQALGRVMTGARAVTEKTKLGLDNTGNCFVGAFMKVDGTVVHDVALKAGTDYAFAGGGDETVEDLDLYLLDKAGKIVAQDEEEDAAPVVEFTPKANGQYRIVMKLVAGQRSGFACYAAFRTGGIDVPVVNLNTSAERLMKLCTAFSTKLGSAFHDAPGEVALVGTILAQGETLIQSGITLPKGNHAFAATGDTQIENLDLALTSPDGKVLEQDTEADDAPIITYDKAGPVVLKITNTKSKGPSLVIAALLKTE